MSASGRHVGFDNDGHNHDDQLGEIYPTMLNELDCTFGVSFSHFHCCGRHGIGPLWSPLELNLFELVNA